MSRTVTAMFDSREDAEAARSRLSQSDIDADRVRIVDQNESGSGDGFWSSVKSAFMPAEDSHAYDEGLRRGSFLLCAEVDEDEADRAIDILDQGNSVDFDQRQQEWRNEGWTGFSGSDNKTYNRRETGTEIEEERIPLVEEQLSVGKREIERGGARVRSYIRETPVHDQINLREEHVSVERRPVDQPLGRNELDSDSDLLRERNIEMTEHSEQAVVGKEARVREELVVKKTAEERTEQIDDQVRRTEVEVDGISSSDDRSAFGGFDNSRTSSDAEGSKFETDAQRGEREAASFDSSSDRSDR